MLSNLEKRQKMPIKNDESDPTNNYLECEENYYFTKETIDWINCVKCYKWLHESCTNVRGSVQCLRENKN